MTREELIKAIDNDLELCPDYNCDLPEKEGNIGDCCRKCGEKQLADYETRIRAEERGKMLMPYDVESVEELVANVRSKTIDEVKQYLLKHKKTVREIETKHIYDAVKVEWIIDLKEGEQNV